MKDEPKTDTHKPEDAAESELSGMPCSAIIQRYGCEMRVKMSLTIDGVKYEESAKGFEVGKAATRATLLLYKKLKRSFFE
jgi:hypothetical protein